MYLRDKRILIVAHVTYQSTLFAVAWQIEEVSFGELTYQKLAGEAAGFVFVKVRLVCRASTINTVQVQARCAEVVQPPGIDR